MKPVYILFPIPLGLLTFICIVLYCIVLKGWSLLSKYVLRTFQIYFAPPNLDITRKRIRLLNFAQRPIFFRLEVTSLKSQTLDLQLKVPPGGLEFYNLTLYYLDIYPIHHWYFFFFVLNELPCSLNLLLHFLWYSVWGPGSIPGIQLKAFSN